MMRTHHKGFIAPWSYRRESAGLMGTFIVFFLSYPGHTDSLAGQTRHLVQQLVQLVLVFLGLLSPAVQAPAAHFHRAMARIHRHAPVIAPVLSPVAIQPAVPVEVNAVPMNAFHHQITYIFEGIATFRDQPCPNASVLVRLVNGEQSVTQGVITGADGSYHLKATINARTGDPVDWTLVAYTVDFNKVELSGRRIVEQSDDQETHAPGAPVIVNAPVEFLVSLSK